MPLFTRTVPILLLLCLGFTAGWWLRGVNLQSPAAANGPTFENGWAHEDAPALRYSPHENRPDALPDKPQATQRAALPALDIKPAPTPPEPTAVTEPVNVAQEFRALLQAQSFDAAMNLYAATERRSSAEALELKSQVKAVLETHLRDGNGRAFTGLVDAFLSRYYDDIDILLLLARYHLASDYAAEAARTFQLAFTYAFSQAEQRQVNHAFHSFVADTDALLANQNRWSQLISFYENLELLDLTQPQFQLRQAELYIAHGEPLYGHQLLQRLAGVPSVAAQATALMEDASASPTPSRDSEPRDAVALETVGSHYHLPLQLNGTAPVRLIIDTGATTTTLSKTAFEAIRDHSGFTELGPQMFNTASGVAKGMVYRAEQVQLGHQLLSDIHIAVLDFGMPPEVDGLLGMNVLRHFRFQVDQDERMLYLRQR